MSRRKCIYTGKEAKVKDNVIPKSKAEDEVHNWINDVPCNDEYKEYKQGRLPTEDEILAHEYFTLMEMHKVKVKYYELKLADIQKKIKEKKCINNTSKKNTKIKKSNVKKETPEPKSYEEILQKRKESLWD